MSSTPQTMQDGTNLTSRKAILGIQYTDHKEVTVATPPLIAGDNHRAEFERHFTRAFEEAQMGYSALLEKHNELKRNYAKLLDENTSKVTDVNKLQSSNESSKRELEDVKKKFESLQQQHQTELEQLRKQHEEVEATLDHVHRTRDERLELLTKDLEARRRENLTMQNRHEEELKSIRGRSNELLQQLDSAQARCKVMFAQSMKLSKAVALYRSADENAKKLLSSAPLEEKQQKQQPSSQSPEYAEKERTMPTNGQGSQFQAGQAMSSPPPLHDRPRSVQSAPAAAGYPTRPLSLPSARSGESGKHTFYSNAIPALQQLQQKHQRGNASPFSYTPRYPISSHRLADGGRGAPRARLAAKSVHLEPLMHKTKFNCKEDDNDRLSGLPWPHGYNPLRPRSETDQQEERPRSEKGQCAQDRQENGDDGEQALASSISL